jgi:translation initiation factor 1
MDLRDQLKNLFPEHEEQDFEMPEEQFEQKNPLFVNMKKKAETGNQ